MPQLNSIEISSVAEVAARLIFHWIESTVGQSETPFRSEDDQKAFVKDLVDLIINRVNEHSPNSPVIDVGMKFEEISRKQDATLTQIGILLGKDIDSKISLLSSNISRDLDAYNRKSRGEMDSVMKKLDMSEQRDEEVVKQLQNLEKLIKDLQLKESYVKVRENHVDSRS